MRQTRQTDGTTIGRRGLLAGAAAMGLAGAGACAASPHQRHADRSPSPKAPHQAGILTRPPDAAIVAAFDVRVPDRDQLGELLRRLTARIAAVPGEVLVSVGAALFDDRYGLAAYRPAKLTTMPSFPNDVLDPAHCHGDLLLQVCAPDADTAQTSLAELQDAAGPGLLARWRVPAFRQENTVAGNGRPITRNLLGFQEGMSNPDTHDAATMAQLVWLTGGGGEPAWTAGGSYHVVRLIRFGTELWDREPLSTQEAVFGRRRSDGRVLGHEEQTDEFTYADDPTGRLIALDAHIRRANPRTPDTAGSRILRRGYSYRTNTEAGLVFVCFQSDLRRGFETVQRRLAGEALTRYILPFGGGYFFALPGATGGDHIGARMLAGG